MPNKASVARLNQIASLVAEALMLADQSDDYMVAAKLDDTLICVRERLATLKD